jgi:putative ABC transport system permease protein
MFRIILRFTLRNLRKNVFYQFISIGGLIIALASAFFILVWVNHETSFDRFHPNNGRLYRLSFEYEYQGRHTHFARSYQDWVLYLEDYFPEIEEIIRLQPMRTTVVRIDEDKFISDRNFAADSGFFSVFGFELKHGDPDAVLAEPKSVVITESLAETYFGDADPIGQPLYFGHQFDTVQNLYTVAGVMTDFPVNSHFHIDILGSMDDPKQHVGWSYLYVLLREGTDPGDILQKFPGFLKQHMDEEHIERWTPHLQPIEDIHLHSHKDREIEHNGNAGNVYIFIIVAIILIIIAFINYANIQLATINKKLVFIFLNRVVGARIRDVSKFIAFESATHQFIAFVLSLMILVVGLPWLNRYFGFQLSLDQPVVWLQVLVLGLIVGFLGALAGSLPVAWIRFKEKLSQLTGSVFYESGFRSIITGGGITSRKIMIVIQFTGSILLILCTLLVSKQVHYMLDGGIGSNNNDILILKNLSRPVLDKYPVFKQEILESPLIKEVSASMEEPGHDVMDAMAYEMEGMDESRQEDYIGVMPVDDSYLDFYDIPLIAGRNFPDYQGMEANEHYILNESALKKLGFKSPEDALGRSFRLVFQWPEIFKGGEIIGVCKDFHYYSMATPVKPLVLFQKHIWFWCFAIRVDNSNFREAVNYLSETWRKIYPDYPFEYHFVDDLYASLYQAEILQSRVMTIFALLTILLACLGLAGLMMYSAEIRTKEIGIRKVNGARIFQILYLLNKNIMLWIMVSMIIAFPASWYIMSKWLQNFAFRINMAWPDFILVGISVFIIALLSTSVQSFRAAGKNPVESLRYE